MGKIIERIKEHPVTTGIALLVSVLGGAGVLLEWSSRIADVVGRTPMILRVLITVVLLAAIGVALWLMARIAILVRAVPGELKRENAELKQLLRNAKEENAELHTTNTQLSQWREGRRGWESEKESALASERALQAEVARLSAVASNAETLAGENVKLAAERDDWQRETVALRQRFRYGSALIHVSEMTDAEAVAIRPQLEELLHSVDAAFNAAAPVWREVQSRCRDAQGNAPTFWLALFVDEHVTATARNSANLLLESLQQKRDSRAPLAAAYAAYRSWRRWIVRLGEMTGLESGWGGYSVWAEADRLLDSELDRKLGISQLAEVRQSVRSDRLPDDAVLPPPSKGIW